jgi:hypothetical protein
VLFKICGHLSCNPSGSEWSCRSLGGLSYCTFAGRCSDLCAAMSGGLSYCTFAGRCSDLCAASHTGVVCLLCLKFHCCICYLLVQLLSGNYTVISVTFYCQRPAVNIDITVVNWRRAFAQIYDKEFLLFVAFRYCEVDCMIKF